MARDLQALADSICSRYEFPVKVYASWAPHDRIAEYFGFPVWAAYDHDSKVIALSDRLRTAPYYVIDYLLTHEILHNLVPYRGNCNHPRAFRVAEQTHPNHIRAARWLHQLARRMKYPTVKISKRSYSWRTIIAPLYFGDYAKYVREYKARLDRRG